MKCILIWQICKNMHQHFADGATVPSHCKLAWVWLRWLWRLACGNHSAVAASAAQAMEAQADFLPAVDKDQANHEYVHPVGVAPFPLPKHSGPQGTNPEYPGLSQFIWWYPWSNQGPDHSIKNYSVFRWTVEIWRGVTRPAAAAARQSGQEMNETWTYHDGMSTSEGISQDSSV